MDDVLAQQQEYYRARAPEYDDWWFRRGRYDRGAEENARWLADQAEVAAALDVFAPTGDVLELAAGTGLWTERLTPHAAQVTAVDASPEVLAINRERVGDAAVKYVEADLFAWHPSRQFDVCFIGFWLSHVPESRFDAFWETVAAGLRPGGRVFLVDSLRQDPAHSVPGSAAELARRTLADGRAFEIVKRFYDPAELSARTAKLGWLLDLRAAANGNFLYGSGTRTR